MCSLSPRKKRMISQSLRTVMKLFCYDALFHEKLFCTDHGRIVNICRLYCCQATGRCWPSAPNLRGIKYTNCLNAALVEGRSSQSTGGIRPLATDWTSFLQESVSLRSFSKLWQEEPSSHILELITSYVQYSWWASCDLLPVLVRRRSVICTRRVQI